MGKFEIKVTGVHSAAEDLGEMAKQLKTLEGRFDVISNEIKRNGTYNLQNSLDAISDQLGGEQRLTANLSNSLKTILRFYADAEKDIQKMQLNKSGTNTDDDSSSVTETFDRDYFDTMSDYYGFSKEDAQAIKEAYEAFENSDLSKGLNNREKINLFFSNMASLYSDYSGDSFLFKHMGDNPTQSDAVKFFNDLGVDGENLKDIVNNQHSTCGDNRDFAHECAIYSVMSNKNLQKWAAGKFDNIDELVGFKGDIYSKSMGTDDIKSDIAAVNIYNRMLNSSDDDIFDAFTDYNKGCADGTINESREFLEYYGNGDAEEGIKNLTNRIEDTSAGTLYLSGEYGESSENNDTTIEYYKNKFLNYLIDNSGVND